MKRIMTIGEAERKLKMLEIDFDCLDALLHERIRAFIPSSNLLIKDMIKIQTNILILLDRLHENNVITKEHLEKEENNFSNRMRYNMELSRIMQYNRR